jgi:hypothetical protein
MENFNLNNIILMENLNKFICAIKDNLDSIQAFKLSCLYKDICLQNYKYKPRLICNQVIHEWEHSCKKHTLTVDIIRETLTYDLWVLFNEMQVDLSESQLNSKNGENETLQRQIKKMSEICIFIKNGILFKEFIDNYRLGYFN